MPSRSSGVYGLGACCIVTVLEHGEFRVSGLGVLCFKV